MLRSAFVTLIKMLPVGIGLSLATPASAVDGNLYLVALAVQSNMTGAGDVKLLPVGFPMNGRRIWNFTNADDWEHDPFVGSPMAGHVSTFRDRGRLPLSRSRRPSFTVLHVPRPIQCLT